jgi:hypothetical protein
MRPNNNAARVFYSGIRRHVRAVLKATTFSTIKKIHALAQALMVLRFSYALQS